MADPKIVARDKALIDSLGGTMKVAAGISQDPRVVSNWRKRGISAAGKYQVVALARKRRVKLPEGFAPQ